MACCNPSHFLRRRREWYLFLTLESSVKHFPRIPAFRKHRRLAANLRRAFVVGMLLLEVSSLRSQTVAASKAAVIKSFRLVQEKDGQAVEILSTKPLVPSIQAISDPARIVIDLPNATLGQSKGVPQRIEVQADQISALRANQFQANPPITRIVVDLQAPRAFTWDAAGNRLVVHLGKRPTEVVAVTAPSVTGLSSRPAPVVASVRAAGPLSLAGNSGSVGSTIMAGAETAIVRLSSGGEVHVCPGTTVSVTPSQNRHNLMLSMNTGAMEAHFGLDASSDTVMTPDFRILLVGPGEFHYAFSADAQGNTCVRALAGNTASAIVSELLGDRTYQVKATDQLVFRAGQLDRVDMAVPLECGCPPVHDEPMRATSEVPLQSRVQSGTPSAPLSASPGNSPVEEAANVAGASPPVAASAAPGASNDLHVQVEAPFVFHATGPPPVAMADVSALPLATRSTAAPGVDAALPPPANDKTKASTALSNQTSSNETPPRGFFHKLGRFFSALFR